MLCWMMHVSMIHTPPPTTCIELQDQHARSAQSQSAQGLMMHEAGAEAFRVLTHV